MSTVIRVALFVLLSSLAHAQLVTRGGGGASVRLASQTVSATVTDGLANVRVKQVFRYGGQNPAEAIYAFPLPEDASLTGLSMTVGGQRLEGVLAERKKARRVYDSIVHKRRDPALLEKIGDGMFRLSVAPVMPKVDTIVELSYTQRAPLTGGAYHLVVPLGGSHSSGAATTATIDLRASAPIGEVTTNPTNAHVAKDGDRRRIVSWESAGDDVPPAGLSITARLAEHEPSFDVRTYRDERGDAWFTAVYTPGAIEAKDLMPRDLLLVLDVSGSMEGEKIARAREAARGIVLGLRETDRMNLVLFSSHVRATFPEMQFATEENKAALLDAIDGAHALGSTALGDALLRAAAEPEGERRSRITVLLTDGRPTFGITDSAELVEIARTMGEAGLRLHAFGVGEDLDDVLLAGMATAARGESQTFSSALEIEPRVQALLARTSAPALCDLQLTAEGVEIGGRHPRSIPDSYLGGQVVVSGRVHGHGEAKFTLVAQGRDGEVRTECEVSVPSEAAGDPAVALAYASAKLRDLDAAHRLRSGLSDSAYRIAARHWERADRGAYSTREELVAEMIATSLRHGVQCAYTSFLAVEPRDRARLGRRDGGTDEPVVEDFEIRDHNETDVDEEFELGPDTDSPFDSSASNGSIGIGGGAGGRFGGRFGGRRNLRAGGGVGIEQCFHDALIWLRDYSVDANEPATLRGTALTLLAFQSDGHTMTRGAHKETVKVVVKRLIEMQNRDTGRFDGGAVRTTGDTDPELDHLLSTLALAESYAIDKSVLVRAKVQKGLRHARAWFVDPDRLATLSAEALIVAMELESTARSAALKSGDLRSAYDEVARRWKGGERGAALTIARLSSIDDVAAREPLASPLVTELRGMQKGPVVVGADLVWWASDAIRPVGGETWKAMRLLRFEFLVDRQRKDRQWKGSWASREGTESHATLVERTAACALALQAEHRLR